MGTIDECVFIAYIKIKYLNIYENSRNLPKLNSASELSISRWCRLSTGSDANNAIYTSDTRRHFKLLFIYKSKICINKLS